MGIRRACCGLAALPLVLLLLSALSTSARARIRLPDIGAIIAASGRAPQRRSAADRQILHSPAFQEASADSRISERPMNLRGVDPSVLGHAAGFFKLQNRVDSWLFYMYFQSRSGPNNTDPFILWLTGGPGCASSYAAFVENGPYTINSDNKTLSWNPYGWDTMSNIVFLDQPVGSGYSYTTNASDYARQGSDYGEDMYNFLQEFLGIHPELVDRPFFITGESYAGHYIPVIATRIIRGNKEKTGIHINLQVRSQHCHHQRSGNISQQHLFLVLYLNVSPPNCLSLLSSSLPATLFVGCFIQEPRTH